jgi:hypothetical protein
MKNKGFLGVGRNAYHRWCQKIEKKTPRCGWSMVMKEGFLKFLKLSWRFLR